MMSIKELLNSHFDINQAIEAKLEQLEELKSLAARVTVSPFTESHCEGTHSDRVGRTTARIIDLENEINDEIDKLVEVKMQIKLVISSIPDSIRRTILERHYILNESWEKISEKVGYSSRHIIRMHNKTIDELEKKYGQSA